MEVGIFLVVLLLFWKAGSGLLGALFSILAGSVRFLLFVAAILIVIIAITP